METVGKKLYEGMFLVDSAKAAADWDSVITTIENIFKKADAEVVSIKKWEERKLAYEIDHKERGTYILTYFKAPGGSIENIERNAQLSEDIMRVLILSTEPMGETDIAKETPEMREERRRKEHEEAVRLRAEEAASKAAEASEDVETDPTGEADAAETSAAEVAIEEEVSADEEDVPDVIEETELLTLDSALETEVSPETEEEKKSE
ncbi:MAG: 30S ribosomal protein S6 [Planctomycetota bacterium]